VMPDELRSDSASGTPITSLSDARQNIWGDSTDAVASNIAQMQSLLATIAANPDLVPMDDLSELFFDMERLAEKVEDPLPHFGYPQKEKRFGEPESDIAKRFPPTDKEKDAYFAEKHRAQKAAEERDERKRKRDEEGWIDPDWMRATNDSIHWGMVDELNKMIGFARTVSSGRLFDRASERPVDGVPTDEPGASREDK
jgi:hypothetical protein